MINIIVNAEKVLLENIVLLVRIIFSIFVLNFSFDSCFFPVEALAYGKCLTHPHCHVDGTIRCTDHLDDNYYCDCKSGWTGANCTEYVGGMKCNQFFSLLK